MKCLLFSFIPFFLFGASLDFSNVEKGTEGLMTFCFETDLDALEVCERMNIKEPLQALDNSLKERNDQLVIQKIEAIFNLYNRLICNEESWVLDALIKSERYNHPLEIFKNELNQFYLKNFSLIETCEDYSSGL